MLPPPSLEKFAYETIKKAILEFRLKPGDSLVEADLSKQLNISKTPIRDALSRLEKEGLVSKVPYTGTTVSPIDNRAVKELFELRAVLEGLSARKATDTLLPIELEQLQKNLIDHISALKIGNLIQAAALNRQFHTLIIKAAGSERLTAILANLDDHLQRYRVLSNTQRGKQSKSVEEHQIILNALRTRNSNDAESAMRAHLMSVVTDLEHVDISALITCITSEKTIPENQNPFTE
jgi:DNA-binding GntR family transcriptional regulator